MKRAESHDVTLNVAGRELTIIGFLRALHRNQDQMRQGHNQVRQHLVWDSRAKFAELAERKGIDLGV